MSLAWCWVHVRAKFYPETGGFSDLDDYLAEGRVPSRKQVFVFRGVVPVSLITIEMTAPGMYLFHITSPRKADREAITQAVYEVGSQLFEQIQTGVIYTTVPSYRGHVHKGSKRIVEACGMTPYSTPEESEMNGHRYNWQPYAITYEQWKAFHYGKQDKQATLREQ